MSRITRLRRRLERLERSDRDMRERAARPLAWHWPLTFPVTYVWARLDVRCLRWRRRRLTSAVERAERRAG